MDINSYLVPGKRAHLAGIGGVSMRPLGLVLRRMGMEISGSDMNASVSTDELIAKVASKGGTTEQALKMLDELSFDRALTEAMKACTRRAEELGKTN